MDLLAIIITAIMGVDSVNLLSPPPSRGYRDGITPPNRVALRARWGESVNLSRRDIPPCSGG